jgi:hypothetical protein
LFPGDNRDGVDGAGAGESVLLWQASPFSIEFVLRQTGIHP